MACYHPLKGVKILQPDGKYKVKIIGSVLRDREQISAGVTAFDKIGIDIITGVIDTDSVSIPCGKCIGCRLEYSREWADRIVLESMSYPENTCWFITLTYDDDHLPLGRLLYNDDIFPTLSKADLKKFTHDLLQYYDRKYDHTGIRYYVCGEYGEKSMRPHYHMCVFNMPLLDSDLKPYKRNLQGDMLYNCPMLESLWKKGFVVVGDLGWKTAAYTARYVLKKWKKSTDKLGFDPFEVLGIDNQWSVMSRRPGIAQPYFLNNMDKIYKNDNIILPGGQIIQPPLYYDKLYKEINPSRLEAVKLNRVINGSIARDESISRTDYDELEYFTIKEQAHNKGAKKLLRTL